MKRREILYIIIITIILLLIATVVGIVVINVQNNDNPNHDVDNNDISIDKDKLYNTWYEKKIEYYDNGSYLRTVDLPNGYYIIIDQDTFKYCFNSDCTNHKYTVNNNTLSVYDVEDKNITYRFEIQNNNKLLLIYDDDITMAVYYEC